MSSKSLEKFLDKQHKLLHASLLTAGQQPHKDAVKFGFDNTLKYVKPMLMNRGLDLYEDKETLSEYINKVAHVGIRLMNNVYTFKQLRQHALSTRMILKEMREWEKNGEPICKTTEYIIRRAYCEYVKGLMESEIKKGTL